MILCNYEYFNEGVNLLDNKVWEYNLVMKKIETKKKKKTKKKTKEILLYKWW